MLGFLSASAARLLNIPFEPSGFDVLSIPEDEETLAVDIDALRRLVRPLPDLAWRGIAGMCGQAITPMYKSLQTMLVNDVEHVARLLSELELELEPLGEQCDLCRHHEPSCRRAMMLPSDCPHHMTPHDPSARFVPEDASPQDRPRRKRRRSSTPSDRPVTIPSTHPSTPIIIITPCISRPRDATATALPPFQDSCFGNRLTLPTSYPIFNDVFPPLLPTATLHPLLHVVVDKWRWVDGHWRAVLPTLEEQRRQGLSSRPLLVKRRANGRNHRTMSGRRL